MALRPYTQRFILTSVKNVPVVYTVPENKRAVVQTVLFSNRGTVEGSGYATLHGYQVIFRPVPVGVNFQFTDLRLALYERETCEIYLTADGMCGAIAGYLFDDPEGKPAAELGLGDRADYVDVPTVEPS